MLLEIKILARLSIGKETHLEAQFSRCLSAIFQPYTNSYLWVGRCRDTSCITTCVSFDLCRRISFQRTWKPRSDSARNWRRRKDQMAQNLDETLLLLANVGFEFEGQESSFILNRWRWNSRVSNSWCLKDATEIRLQQHIGWARRRTPSEEIKGERHRIRAYMPERNIGFLLWVQQFWRTILAQKKSHRNSKKADTSREATEIHIALSWFVWHHYIFSPQSASTTDFNINYSLWTSRPKIEI